MLYVSTRGATSPISFSKAVMMGLGRDGGLLLPESIPNVKDNLQEWAKLNYADLAFEIIRLFADDIPDDILRDIINRSYASFRDNAVTPVKKIGSVHILELFHGPTLAFKDVALQFLGNMFEYLLSKSEADLNILAATSGDTGSAAIYGVRGCKHIKIFVMYPNGKVSPVQEMQMTSVTDANVFNIALDGTFDDCQNIVKTLMNDLAFRDKYNLGAVNSINWARVLAQVVYYFYSGLHVINQTKSKKISFSVPTGNFGDIFAGYVAALMGLPIEKLILATNENDILYRFFNTGVYSIGGVVPTISPSMDIQISSNFERWLYLHFNKDADKLRRTMEEFSKNKSLTLNTGGRVSDPFIIAGRADTKATLKTIKNFYAKYDYLLDPHSAVGVSVALESGKSDCPIICLATAHPAKFPGAIEQAVGTPNLAVSPHIEHLKSVPTRKYEMNNDASLIAEFIRKHS